MNEVQDLLFPGNKIKVDTPSVKGWVTIEIVNKKFDLLLVKQREQRICLYIPEVLKTE
jgi:hypothetical protein